MVEANEGGVGRSPTPTIAESVVVDCECKTTGYGDSSTKICVEHLSTKCT